MVSRMRQDPLECVDTLARARVGGRRSVVGVAEEGVVDALYTEILELHTICRRSMLGRAVLSRDLALP